MKEEPGVAGVAAQNGPVSRGEPAQTHPVDGSLSPSSPIRVLPLPPHWGAQRAPCGACSLPHVFGDSS